MSRGELLAKRSLLGEESLAVASLDAPVQPGDDRSGVLGDHECLLVGQLPELLGTQNRDLLGVDRASSAPSHLPRRSRDTDAADQVGDLLVERHVLRASEPHQHVGEPHEGAGLLLAEDRRQLPERLGRVDERQPERPLVRHPCPQRRKRRGGRQLVQAGQHGRAQASVPAGVGLLERGVQDMLGHRGHQRGRRRVRILTTEQVDGPTAHG